MDVGVYAPCEAPQDERCARAHDGPRHDENFRWETASGWGSVVTGMNAAGHGVRGNAFEEQGVFADSSRAHPTFFKMLRDRGLRTAAGGVGNFLTSRDGEEIDAGVVDFECGLKEGVLRVQWTDKTSCNLDHRRADDLESEERDENLARWLKQRIAADDAQLLMGVFDEVDAAGHSFGFEDDEGYPAAIASVDTLVGAVLGSLVERVVSLNQAWLVVLTSDHGGHDVLFGLLGHHHQTPLWDDAVPFVVATFGTGRPLRPVTSPVRHMDVHPTVMAWFGLDPGPVDGRAQGIPSRRSLAGSK